MQQRNIKAGRVLSLNMRSRDANRAKKSIRTELAEVDNLKRMEHQHHTISSKNKINPQTHHYGEHDASADISFAKTHHYAEATESRLHHIEAEGHVGEHKEFLHKHHDPTLDTPDSHTHLNALEQTQHHVMSPAQREESARTGHAHANADHWHSVKPQQQVDKHHTEKAKELGAQNISRRYSGDHHMLPKPHTPSAAARDKSATPASAVTFTGAPVPPTLTATGLAPTQPKPKPSHPANLMIHVLAKPNSKKSEDHSKPTTRKSVPKFEDSKPIQAQTIQLVQVQPASRVSIGPNVDGME